MIFTMPSQLATWVSGWGSLPAGADDDETYLKSLYRNIGGQPRNIEHVHAVPMGARKPAAYRLVRRDGAWTVIWRKHIVDKDVETISRLLEKIC